MKLARLLEQNDGCKPAHALLKNFGDSYLCEYNRLYSQIRKVALARGFQYTLERNDFYQALPLSQLENVQQSKKIPYFDNVTVLRDVELRVKSGVLWDDVADNLRKNYVFHESCHAVSRGFSDELLKASDPHSQLLKMFLEESFANTCELLAVLDAGDPAHRVFYEWNSYTFLFEERTNLKNAATDMGEAFLFRFFYLCYLHSNFLADGLDEKSFKRVLDFTSDGSSFDAKKIKTLKALARIAFSLDLRFREVTNSFHLRLNGIQVKPAEIQKIEFMKMMDRDPAYPELMLSLVLAVVGS